MAPFHGRGVAEPAVDGHVVEKAAFGKSDFRMVPKGATRIFPVMDEGLELDLQTVRVIVDLPEKHA